MDEKAYIQFLFDESLQRRRCHVPLSLINWVNKKYHLFICQRGRGKISVSVTKGMWFERSKFVFVFVLMESSLLPKAL